MKNKSILTKILISGVGILFLLTLVLILSFMNLFVPKKEETTVKKNYSEEYILDNISDITFDFKKSNASFKICDSDKLVVVQEPEEEKFYLNYKEKKNKIYFDEDSYIINPQKKEYIIYIPKSYSNKITIINGFGEIDVVGISNELVINNNSGNISLEEVRSVQIKDVSGDILIRNVIGNINASSSTGNIEIKNINGSVNLETITGDIEIHNFAVIGDSNIENVSGDINILLANDAACKINYFNETGKSRVSKDICNMQFNIINVKNITGEININ